MNNYNVNGMGRYNDSLFHEICNKLLVIIVFDCNYMCVYLLSPFFLHPSSLLCALYSTLPPPTLPPSLLFTLHLSLSPSLSLTLSPSNTPTSLFLFLFPNSLFPSYLSPLLTPTCIFIPSFISHSLPPSFLRPSYTPTLLPTFPPSLFLFSMLHPPLPPLSFLHSLPPSFLWCDWTILMQFTFAPSYPSPVTYTAHALQCIVYID